MSGTVSQSSLATDATLTVFMSNGWVFYRMSLNLDFKNHDAFLTIKVGNGCGGNITEVKCPSQHR